MKQLKQQRLDKIIAQRLVFIIRLEDPNDILPIVDCLTFAGVEIVEVTSNTPNYEHCISQINQHYPDLLVGAGTITNQELAEQAIEAGAEFLVTPNTEKSIVDYAHKYNVPVMMGAYTPSEVVTAVKAQADVIKLFPAGTQYLESLAKGPFLNVPFFAVGGVNEINFKEYFHAGAQGIGVGGSLAAPVKNKEERRRLIERVNKLVTQLKELTSEEV